MAAATANLVRKVRDRQKAAFKIKNAVTLWGGAYAAIGHFDNATAGNRGRALSHIDDTAGLIPAGFVDQKEVGDSGETVLASIQLDGHIEYQLAITDIAGDITDVGRKVYLTDDATFTLTAPATIGGSLPVGITIRFNAADSFDVYFFSFGELCAMALAGGARRTWCLGAVVAEAGTGNANLLTGIVCPFHGRLVGYYLICASAPADADVAGPVSLEVNGTDVDYGTANPTINFADTLGLKISGSGTAPDVAIHEGDLIDVESDFTAAGTVGDGIYNVYADIRLEPGV
jgi:hypothetical protein